MQLEPARGTPHSAAPSCRLKPWDVCAGVLIAEEAGAVVTTMEGSPYSVFDRSLLAGAPGLHEVCCHIAWLPCSVSKRTMLAGPICSKHELGT